MQELPLPLYNGNGDAIILKKSANNGNAIRLKRSENNANGYAIIFQKDPLPISAL